MRNSPTHWCSAFLPGIAVVSGYIVDVLCSKVTWVSFFPPLLCYLFKIQLGSVVSDCIQFGVSPPNFVQFLFLFGVLTWFQNSGPLKQVHLEKWHSLFLSILLPPPPPPILSTPFPTRLCSQSVSVVCGVFSSCISFCTNEQTHTYILFPPFYTSGSIL